VGGEVLYLECALLSGKGKITLTGKLGDVMKESAQIAYTLVRERVKRFDINPKQFRETDVHIHVPEGAVPKDGPSAGIGLTMAILSAATKKVIPPTVAFTGEVSLTGKLHAIGGLNEKALAALEAGVKTLYLPEENRKNVSELPKIVKKGIDIRLKSHIDDIIQELF
jgi:ATP-dependent Lon protease